MESLLFSHIIEVFIFLFFGIFITTAIYNKNWKILVIRLVSAIYAIGFESLNMHISSAYQYDNYFVGFAGLPIYIPIARGLIFAHIYAILSANITSKTQGQIRGTIVYNALIYALSGAVYALSIDLTVDVIAVQMKLRTRFLEPTQGWFGVSNGNYIGRATVSFFFLYFLLTLEYKYEMITKKVKMGLFWINIKKYFLTIVFALIGQSLFTLGPIVSDRYRNTNLLQDSNITNLNGIQPIYFMPIVGLVICLNFIFLFQPKMYNPSQKGITTKKNISRKILDRGILLSNLGGLFLCFRLDLNMRVILTSAVSATIYIIYIIKTEIRSY